MPVLQKKRIQVHITHNVTHNMICNTKLKGRKQNMKERYFRMIGIITVVVNVIRYVLSDVVKNIPLQRYLGKKFKIQFIW